MFHNVAKAILRARVVLLAIILGVTAFMGWEAQFVKLSYKPAPLLPQTDSVFIINDRVSSLFGKGENIMVIGLQDSNFFSNDHIEYWRQLEAKLLTIDGVEQVFSAIDAVNLVKNNSLKKFEPKRIFNADETVVEIDSSSKEFCSQAFYKGMLYNPDTHAYLMLVTLNREKITKKERIGLIANIVDTCKIYENETDNRLRYSGLPYIRVTVGEMIKYEMFLFVALAVIVTTLILLILFRSFKIVAISMFVVGIAVVWSLGSLSLFGYDLTLLTGVVPPLLIIIGVPNCIYLINKFHHEFYHHGNRVKALYRVIIRIGSATFLTNLTTAAGFATFIVTKTQILREFGVIASINVIGIFFISLITIPIIFSFLPNPKERHLKHLSNSGFKSAISRIVVTTLYKRKTVFVTSALFVIVGLVGVSLIKAKGYMVDDIPRNHPVYRDLKFFEKNFTGIMPLEIIYDTEKPNGYLSAATFTKIDILQERLKKYSELSKPLSIIEASKFARQAYFNGNESQYKLPGAFERAFILSYLPKSIGISDMFAKMVDSSGRYVRVMYNVADVGSVKMTKLFDSIKTDVDTVFQEQSPKVLVAGASVVYSKGIDYLIHSLVTSLMLAIVIISLTIAWLFRKAKMVMFAVGINMVPLILTAAAMGYLGINLKPSTVIVFSIAFGIAVDNSIHFLSKYRQELRRTNRNTKESVIYAISETGISMIYTSIVLFFGFGVFAASRFGGTQSLGLLVALTLLFAVLANLFILPSVLLKFDRVSCTEIEPEDEPSLEIATGFEDDAEIEKQH
ncbi:MAG: RND family transporter [Bacteroidales bacterium]